MSAWPERLLVILGAVAGCLGVALSAAAAHGPRGATLDTSARFLLVHAPALVGVAAAIAAGLLHRKLALLSAFVLAVGVALFSGDLAVRVYQGAALFPMAAPAGGLALMAGWALLSVTALLGVGRRG